MCMQSGSTELILLEKNQKFHGNSESRHSFTMSPFHTYLTCSGSVILFEEGHPHFQRNALHVLLNLILQKHHLISICTVPLQM